MKEGDFLGAIENYEEGLEYRRDDKALWTNKALAELKIFRWHDAITSCNKVIEYSEIFEDGFTKSADACFKAFTRRAQALRALHRWEDAVADLEDAVKLFPKDREAQDLLVKTKSAREEAKAALVGESQHEGREKQSSDEPPEPGGRAPSPPRVGSLRACADPHRHLAEGAQQGAGRTCWLHLRRRLYLRYASDVR